jgi:CBS domain-containing protein
MFTSTRDTQPHDAVRRVMMWPVAVTPCGTTMRQVAEALAADEIGILPVIANEHLVGVVSERDVVRHLANGADPDHVLVEDIMTTDLLQVTPETSIAEAAQLMVEAGVRHLPVLDGEAVAGVVSARDVLAVLALEASKT